MSGVVALLTMTILLPIGSAISDGRTIRQMYAIPGFAKIADISQPFTNNTNTPGIDSTTSVQTVSSSTLDRYRNMLFSIPGVFSFETFKRYFAAFSWGQLAIPDNWYIFVWFLLAIPLLGLLFIIRRRRERVFIVLAIALYLAVIAAPVWRDGSSEIPNAFIGRFILPALGSICALVALAVDAFPWVLRPITSISTIAGVSLVTLMCPWVVFKPAYQLPVLQDPKSILLHVQYPMNIVYGNQIKLLGYSQISYSVLPGSYAQFVLFWTSLASIKSDWTLQLELFDTRGKSMQIMQRTTPGNGVFPTSDWPDGMAFAETYNVRIPDNMETPDIVGLRISWFDEHTGQYLTVSCGGMPCNPLVGYLPVHLGLDLQSEISRDKPRFIFGDTIDLLDVKLPSEVVAGNDIVIQPFWRAHNDIHKDYTVFVHIWDENNHLAAQTDSPPLDGVYPTHIWSALEIVPDRIIVPLPVSLQKGKYTVKLGVYDSKTKDRLMATDANGVSQQNGIAEVGTFFIR